MTKVFIATPAYEGKVHAQYAISLSDSCHDLKDHGIEVENRIHTSGSLLSFERNRLVSAFMLSDCTHMLCVDSDLGWPAEAIRKMLEKDEEFVAGAYPARNGGGEYCFIPTLTEENKLIISEKGLIQTEYLPAGFLLIKRSVFEKMQLHFPQLYFTPRHESAPEQTGYMFFDTEVWQSQAWGEDYVFCRRAREAGITIWTDPMIEFDHAGTRGCLLQLIRQMHPTKEG